MVKEYELKAVLKLVWVISWRLKLLQVATALSSCGSTRRFNKQTLFWFLS